MLCKLPIRGSFSGPGRDFVLGFWDWNTSLKKKIRQMTEKDRLKRNWNSIAWRKREKERRNYLSSMYVS